MPIKLELSENEAKLIFGLLDRFSNIFNSDIAKKLQGKIEDLIHEYEEEKIEDLINSEE